MKILAFVDLHGSDNALKEIKEASKDVDLIICAGDITIFGDDQKKIVQKIDKIGKLVLMLHGNHENEDSLKKQCKKTKNIKFMHKEVLEYEGYVFVAYGGGGFATTDTEFETWAKTLIEKYKGNKNIIFITHGPPYDTKLDQILDQSAGSKSYRYFIDKVKPKLVLCGHLHENTGVKQKIGRTIMANPGPWGMIFEV